MNPVHMRLTVFLLLVIWIPLSQAFALDPSSADPDAPLSLASHTPLVDEPLTSVDLAAETSAATVESAAASAETSVDSAPLSVTVERPVSRPTPHATRDLLRLQASGDAAGARLPMLGAASNLAVKRYLNSFTHPIPEYFDTNVESSTGGN